MTDELIKSLLFSIGIAVQVITLIGHKLNKKDFKEILKDIGGGFLFIFYAMYIFFQESSPDLNAMITASIYAFCLGFGASFTLSFKKKISLMINEINLFTVNILFLYYCIIQLGFDNFFTKLIYIPTFIALIIFLFKKELTNKNKFFSYSWYIILFIMISIINIFQIMDNGKSSYLSSFFIGSIFLYIWIYFIFLVMLINILDFFINKNRQDAYRGRMAFKEHFIYLASSFNKTKINIYYVFMFLFLLSSFLIINYYNNYIQDSSLIVLILFIASMSSARKTDLIKKDISES